MHGRRSEVLACPSFPFASAEAFLSFSPFSPPTVVAVAGYDLNDRFFLLLVRGDWRVSFVCPSP